MVWFAVTKLTAYVGLASVAAAASLPVFVVGFGIGYGLYRGEIDAGEVAVCGSVSTLLAALVIFRHRANIARLRAGTEDKVDWAKRKKSDEPKPA